MKFLRSAVCLLLSAISILISCTLVYTAVSYNDFSFIIPAIVFIACSVILMYLFLIESFIGYKKFFYENENIIVKRKECIITVIPKYSIKKLTVVYDVVNKKLDNKEEVHYFTFLHNKKRYYVDAKAFGEENLTSFINGLEYKKTTNNLYYFLTMFH